MDNLQVFFDNKNVQFPDGIIDNLLRIKTSAKLNSKINGILEFNLLSGLKYVVYTREIGSISKVVCELK